MRKLTLLAAAAAYALTLSNAYAGRQSPQPCEDVLRAIEAESIRFGDSYLMYSKSVLKSEDVTVVRDRESGEAYTIARREYNKLDYGVDYWILYNVGLDGDLIRYLVESDETYCVQASRLSLNIDDVPTEVLRSTLSEMWANRTASNDAIDGSVEEIPYFAKITLIAKIEDMIRQAAYQ